MYVWGYPTGVQFNGRHLIYLNGVTVRGEGSNDPPFKGVTKFEIAFEMATNAFDNVVASTWHKPSETFTEAFPSKRCGKITVAKDCVFFMWVDSIIGVRNIDDNKSENLEEEVDVS